MENEKKNGGLNSSIVYKLNARLFIRMLSIFLVIDLILCIIFMVGTIKYEREFLEKHLTNYEELSKDEFQNSIFFLESIGYRISQEDLKKRYIEWDSKEKTFWGKVRSLEHNFKIQGKKNPLYVSLDLGEAINIFSKYFIILLIIEGLLLIHMVLKNTGDIRKTLRPLEDLTKATNALNLAENNPDILVKIAGEIDSINAKQLDTRIPVSSAKTELKSLTIAINSMLDRIDKAYQSQMRFVSDASHELRTPIAVIQGYANLLDRWGTEDPDTLKEAIAAIKSESESMKEMIEQLLFLARGDNESMRICLEDVNLAQLSEEVFGEMQLLDKSHVIETCIGESQEGYPYLIKADSGLMKQLLRILIDNSLKYTPSGGLVKITLSEEKSKVTLSVQDEGVGISSQSLPYIFDRFYRADESRNRDTGGTGLGLSIAKWIVDKHKGQMEVVSREGIGTRFKVMLPKIERVEP